MAHAPWFFLPPAQLRLGACHLAAADAHHAHAVLRLRPQDTVTLFDGEGRVGRGSLARAAKEAVVVEVAEIDSVPAAHPRLTIATAVPKAKRWQSLVEKCAELGVDRIQPLHFERSVARRGEPQKWQRWTIEACKQAQRAHLPAVTAPMALSAWLQETASGPCLLADRNGDPLLTWAGQIDRADEVTVVIGPEGGLTPEELAACNEAAFALVRLGPHVLRIETAAMAACALVRGLGPV